MEGGAWAGRAETLGSDTSQHCVDCHTWEGQDPSMQREPKNPTLPTVQQRHQEGAAWAPNDQVYAQRKPWHAAINRLQRCNTPSTHKVVARADNKGGGVAVPPQQPHHPGHVPLVLVVLPAPIALRTGGQVGGYAFG